MQAVRKASHILSRSSIELTRPRTPTIVEQYHEEEVIQRRYSRKVLPEFRVSNSVSIEQSQSSSSSNSIKIPKKESGDLIAILQRQEQEALKLNKSEGTGNLSQVTHKYSLKFRDSELETKFENRSFRKSIKPMKRAVIVLLVIHMLLIGEDCFNAFAQKDEQSFRENHVNPEKSVEDFLRNVILIRAGVALLFVALVLFMIRAQRYYDLFQFPQTQADAESSQKASISENLGPKVSASVESLATIKETGLDTGFPFNLNPSLFLSVFSLILYVAYLGMGILANETFAPIQFYYFRFIVFLDVFIFTYSRMMFRYSVACGVLLLIGYNVVDAFYSDLKTILISDFVFCIVLVFQVSEGYLLEKQLRKNFLMETKITNERSKNLDERDRSEELLKNILPPAVVEQLKVGHTLKLQKYSEASVLLVDMVGFTSTTASMTPVDVITMLNLLFSFLDRIAERFSVEKIKTVGDAYLACAGVPEPRWDHAHAAAEMAIQIIETLPTHLNKKLPNPVALRIGISLGPVIAGVIGTERIMYDIYGGAVVSAHKMEQSGQVNKIQISESFYEHLKLKFPERYIVEEVKTEEKTHFFLSTTRPKKNLDNNSSPNRAAVYRITKSPTLVNIAMDIQTPSTPSPGENPETIPEVTEPIQQGAFLSVSTMPKVPLVATTKRRNSTTVTSTLTQNPAASRSITDLSALSRPGIMGPFIKPNRSDTDMLFSDLFVFLSELKPIKIPENIQTSQLSLRFTHTKIERAFIKYYQLATMNAVRGGIGVYILILVAGEVLEYFSDNFPNLLTHVLRLAVLLPLFIAVLILCYLYERRQTNHEPRTNTSSGRQLMRDRSSTTWNSATVSITHHNQNLAVLDLENIDKNEKNDERVDQALRNNISAYPIQNSIAFAEIALSAVILVSMIELNQPYYAFLLLFSFLGLLFMKVLWWISAITGSIILVMSYAVIYANASTDQFLQGKATIMRNADNIDVADSTIYLVVLGITIVVSIGYKEKLLREEFLSNLILAVERKNLRREQNKTRRLLLNILPEVVAEKLKQEAKKRKRIMMRNMNRRGSEAPENPLSALPNRPFLNSSISNANLFASSENGLSGGYTGYFSGQNVCIYEVVPEATVIFISISDYEDMCATLSVEKSVTLLQKVYTAWDQLILSFQVEKIKAIGGTYMLAAGIGYINKTTSAETACSLAMDLLNQAKILSLQLGRSFNVRIGMCTGPVVAGVIGQSKFAFDAWGDTVNVSSRMETSCADGKIQVSTTTFERTKDAFVYESRGSIAVKGKGNMETYYLVRKRPRGLVELPRRLEVPSL